MRISLLYGLFCLLTALLFLLSLFTGSVDIPMTAVLDILCGGQGENPGWNYIVEDRLSRSVVAVGAGAGLAVAGLLMQTLFRNPLVGPGVLGVSSGASLGVAVALLAPGLFAVGSIGLVLPGILGALGVLLVILWVSRIFRDPASVLITGLMISFFTSAAVSILLKNAGEAQTQQYIFWGFGSYAGVTMSTAWWITGVIIAASIGIWTFSRGLDMLLLGDEQATISGVPVKRLKLISILLSGIVVAVITAYCGPIGFIGIAVPQLVRLLAGRELNGVWVPLCVLVGASVSLLCDMLSRLYVELPLNAVTSLLGAPVVIWILLSYRKSRITL